MTPAPKITRVRSSKSKSLIFFSPQQDTTTKKTENAESNSLVHFVPFCGRDSLTGGGGFGWSRFPQSVKLIAVGNEEHSVGRNSRRIHRAAHVYFIDHLLGLALLHDHDVAIFIAKIDLPINQHR